MPSTSTSTASGPRLPYELIELIIREAWRSHNLTIRERMDMYTSFSLVSIDFAWEFTRIFTSDVHIFSHAHYEFYMHHTYSNDTEFLRKMGQLGRRVDAHTSCRSITAHCPKITAESDSDTMREVYERVAGNIHVKFPCARSFGVVYHDWIAIDGDIASMLLPKQVEVLVVTQVRTVKLAWHGMEDDFRWTTLPRQWRYSVSNAVLPHILRLEVFGGNTALVAGLTKLCPNARAVIHKCH